MEEEWRRGTSTGRDGWRTFENVAGEGGVTPLAFYRLVMMLRGS